MVSRCSQKDTCIWIRTRTKLTNIIVNRCYPIFKGLVNSTTNILRSVNKPVFLLTTYLQDCRTNDDRDDI